MDRHSVKRVQQAQGMKTNIGEAPEPLPTLDTTAVPRQDAVALAMDNASFENVLTFVKLGYRAQRTGWNGKKMWIQIVIPEAENELPYIVMKTAQSTWVPWLASQTDILAHDWRLLTVDEQG